MVGEIGQPRCAGEPAGRRAERRGVVLLVALVAMIATMALIGTVFHRLVVVRRSLATLPVRAQVRWLIESAVERARVRWQSDKSFLKDSWEVTAPSGAWSARLQMERQEAPEGTVLQVVVQMHYRGATPVQWAERRHWDSVVGERAER